MLSAECCWPCSLLEEHAKRLSEITKPIHKEDFFILYMSNKLNAFQKVALATVFATIFLIFVGGLVRAAGAGLGCPDWPKCFGMWIPPTQVSDLPAQFDASLFNVAKTWTEYINRLIGVVIGLLITATFAFSWKYRKTKASIVAASAFAFVAVLFQGWLGGQVVRSGLSEGMITIHMLIAMLILMSLLFACIKAFEEQLIIQDLLPKERTMLQLTSVLLILFTLVQIVIGTQVREAIDVVSDHLAIGNGALWLEQIGNIDEIHRSTSWSVFLTSLFLSWQILYKGLSNSPILKKSTLVLQSMVIFQIILGIVLQYGGMPRSFQVLHLTFSAILLSAAAIQAFILFKKPIESKATLQAQTV
jgi:cytochrome c oxidase assembly protein subunit 15